MEWGRVGVLIKRGNMKKKFSFEQKRQRVKELEKFIETAEKELRELIEPQNEVLGQKE